MNLQELLSKTDFLTSIAQYVGLETLTYFTSISKELRQVLDRAEKVDGALSSAIRSMVCADVFSQAIERVENIRIEYERSPLYSEYFPRKWKDLARVTLQMQNLSFASWIRKPAVVLRVNPENTADRIPRCAHSVVNLGSDTCIVYGGFGGTSWRTDGWGIARRAKVFAFAVKTCSSRVPSSPKQGKQLDIKTKVPVETGDIPCPRYGHTMVNLGENRCGGKALLFGGFREAYFHSPLGDVYTIEWKCSSDKKGNGDFEDYPNTFPSLEPKPLDWPSNCDILVWKKQKDYTSSEFWGPREKCEWRNHRGNHGCAYSWSTRKMYVFGGIRGGAPIGELACLDTENYEWEPLFQVSKGRQPLPRYGCSMNIWNDEIFLFGGANGADFFNEGNDLCDLHAYNIKEGIWTCIMDPAMEVQPPIKVYDSDAKMAADETCQTLHQASKAPPEALGRGHTSISIGQNMIFFGGFIRCSHENDSHFRQSLGMKIARSVPVNIYDCGKRCWKTVKNHSNYDIPWERFAHKVTMFKGFMLIHGGWTFETRSTVSGFNALDLSPMTSANRDSIISSASEVESLDKAHVPPVTSLFWRVTARSLLQSARARARAGTARLRRKKRNCWLATKEKSEQAINYVSAIVASMLVFSLALVPTLVAIVSWKANVGLVKKSRRT